jgi:hypothetical protein
MQRCQELEKQGRNLEEEMKVGKLGPFHGPPPCRQGVSFTCRRQNASQTSADHRRDSLDEYDEYIAMDGGVHAIEPEIWRC